MRRRIPSLIFVASCSDLFHSETPVDAQSAVWDAAKACSQHTFMVLTKRPQKMAHVLNGIEQFGIGPLPNIWLGVSVCNQREWEEKVPILMGIPAGLHFVSVEPMLGPVIMGMVQAEWVICGPETGAGHRPYDITWMEALAKECAEQYRPFFDKREQYIRREWPGKRKGGGA